MTAEIPPTETPLIETTTIQPFPARRTAVVTGAGAPRGIGRHVVRTLVAAGGASPRRTSTARPSRSSPPP